MSSTESGPQRRAVIGSYLLGFAFALAAGLITLSLPDLGESTFDAPWWMIVPIAVGFVVAERFTFSATLRRDTISFTLTEVPTVFALAFLGPVQTIVIRVIGSGLAGVGRRSPPYKNLFNVSLSALEAAIAFAVVRSMLDVGSDQPGRFMLASGLALAIAAVVGLFAVCAVVSLFEGAILPQLRRALPSTLTAGIIGSMVGAVAIAPAFVGLEYAALPLLPIVGAWMVLYRHGVLVQSHRELADLHRFSRIIDQSIKIDAVAPLAVEEIAVLLRAGRVTLALEVPDADGVVETRRWHVGASLDPEDTTVLEGPTGGAEQQAEAASGEELASFTIQLADGSDEIGSLSVADRIGGPHMFTAADLERGFDLANQLTTSLRNGLLHASVERAALHDGLTGEANRPAFELRLLDELAAPVATTSRLAVMVLDLNQFKDVNDTLGHHVGDQVLAEFSRRVSTVLEPNDLLSRFGGDEFAILLRRRTADAIRDVAEKILAASYSPLELEVCDAVVTTSIGIAYVHGHDSDPAGVLRRADIAMYAAKNQRSGIEVYREEIDRRTPARLSLLGDLRSAIERDELEVHYQPKVELLTSTVVGAEALVRWQYAGRGWVAPSDFVGVAEESGLVRLLTQVVLRKAVRRAYLWRSAGFDLDVSVNLSALDLHDETLVPSLRETLEEFGVEASCLVVEITESALMVDTVRTLATIEQLDLLGVRLSLDDFGTGYSSLAHLRQLPVSELKIDRSFVSDLLVNVHDDVIVRSTIDLGHNLGLRVVAEGIENVQVADHLTALGCDVGQGFGISRPLAPELFDRWLETTVYPVARVGDSRVRR